MLYLSLRKGSDYCQRIDILLLNKLKRICFNNFGLIFFSEQTLTQKRVENNGAEKIRFNENIG
jgi:hypothetical protein